MRGNEQLRSGVDITLRPEGRTPIRLLGIHLKSGCFSGSEAKACPIFQDQIPALEAWIDGAAAGPDRFAVLGDWNSRLALPGDIDRKSVVSGKSVSVRLDLGGRRILKKKKK